MKRITAFVGSAVLVLLASCSGPEVRFRSDDFPFETIPQHRLAVGGLVGGARTVFETSAEEGEPIPGSVLEQADLWSHYLATEFLLQAPDLDVWPWATVADQAGPDLLERILQNHARGGLLPPEDLAALAEALPGRRFLILARIDGDEIDLQSGASVGQDLRLNPSGLGKSVGDAEVPALERTGYSLRRTVRLSMDLYDLDSGRSLWAADVSHAREDLLDSESANEDAAVRVEKDPATDDGIRIHSGSRLTGGPTLEDVLPGACRVLVADFLTLTAPQDAPAGEQ